MPPRITPLPTVTWSWTLSSTDHRQCGKLDAKSGPGRPDHVPEQGETARRVKERATHLSPPIDSPDRPGMDRRRFLLTAVAGALAAPLAAEGQQMVKNVPRVGLLQPGVRRPEWAEAFRQGLRDLGYVEGRNIVVEHKITYGSAGQRQVIADFVRRKVDVIVTWGMPAVLAAKHETRATPIVGVVPDPRGTGFITTLAKLGGNYTELSIQPNARALTTLRLLKEELPNVCRVALLQNLDYPASADQLRWLQRLQDDAPLLGVSVLIFDDRLMKQIGDLGARDRPRVIHGSCALIVEAGLMSYGVVRRPHLLRQAAAYVDQILKGGKPADLTVEPPARLRLAIDLKTATGLGFRPAHSQSWLVPIRRLADVCHEGTVFGDPSITSTSWD
jgi:putative ABC transport system substrate-binding protein